MRNIFVRLPEFLYSDPVHKPFFFFVILLVFSGNLSAQTTPIQSIQLKKHFALKVSGGLAHWRLTDWNDSFRTYVMSSDGEESNLLGDYFHWGKDSEVELQYIFNPIVKVGIGFQHAWGKGEGRSLQTASDGRYWKDADTIETRITPIYFTLYGTSLSYPNQYYFGIGMGYYLSKFQRYRESRDADSTGVEASIIFNEDMSANSIGFHVVTGLEYFLSQKVGLVAEVRGRYVKISGYNGKFTETIDGGTPSTYNAESYVITYQRDDSVEDREAEVFTAIRENETEPRDWDYYKDINNQIDRENYKFRKTVMDFSGFSLKIGMAYHF
ncbi:hypothetical protein ACFLT7_04780 [candidate division KSB1 bacterium]